MRIDHENLLKKAFEDGINLFFGAGFSVLASSQDGRALPLGRQLADELVTEFEVPELSKLPLSQLSTVLESKQKTNCRIISEDDLPWCHLTLDTFHWEI